MNENLTKRFETALRQEIALMEGFDAEQLVMRGALVKRSWEELERSIRSLQAMAVDIETQEIERESTFHALKDEARLEPGASFYELAVSYPEEKRREITELYRSFKFLALKVRDTSAALSEYISSAQNTFKSIIDELYPQKAGKIYTKHGKTVEADMDALVLNKSL